MSPSDLPARLQTLSSARDSLRRRSVDSLIEALDSVAQSWLQPGSVWLERAAEVLPASTGFSRRMIEHGMAQHFSRLRAADLRRLLDDELGDRHRLDSNRVSSTLLIAHILSGNIPGLAAAQAFLSLVTKHAAILKPAAGDPLSPGLVAESIAAVDPELGKALAVVAWQGGNRAYEDQVFEAADVVVAFGSDAAMSAIRDRCPNRFIGHGHKISFAAIDRAHLAEESTAGAVADKLAYDVALWDQQGCLSPQLCFVEADSVSDLDRFAEMLATALDRIAIELPPRLPSFDERVAISRFRQAAEWSGTAGSRLLASSMSSAWSLAIETDGQFMPSCLNRCLRLKLLADLSELPKVMADWQRYLECAGLAVDPLRRREISDRLAQSGVHRVCEIGEMQTPGLDWRQGGRPRVAEWLED